MSLELNKILDGIKDNSLRSRAETSFFFLDSLSERLKGWTEERRRFVETMERELGIPQEQFVYLLALELRTTPDEIRAMALDDFNWMLTYVCARRRAERELVLRQHKQQQQQTPVESLSIDSGDAAALDEESNESESDLIESVH